MQRFVKFDRNSLKWGDLGDLTEVFGLCYPSSQKEVCMKRFIILLILILLITTKVEAQTVTYNYPDLSRTAAQVTGYISTLYVNGTLFILSHNCVLITTTIPNVITCTANLPNITSALTASGPQNFEVTLKDVILESSKSIPPFVLNRPNAVTGLRIQ